MRDREICIRVHEPDYSEIPDIKYDWALTVHGETSEIIPNDIPEPLDTI